MQGRRVSWCVVPGYAGSRRTLHPDWPMTRSFSYFVLIGLVASFASAADWPQWMGERRNDMWSETGIVEVFPEDGLNPLWRKPISGGFSGPAVAAGRVYVTDYVKSDGD